MDLHGLFVFIAYRLGLVAFWLNNLMDLKDSDLQVS